MKVNRLELRIDLFGMVQRKFELYYKILYLRIIITNILLNEGNILMKLCIILSFLHF